MNPQIQSKVPVKFLQSKWAAHLSLLCFALVSGSAYVGAKLALKGVGPFTTAFLRFLIACIVCWPILILTHGVQKIRKKEILWLIGYGLFQTTFYFALQYYGLNFTTADNTALIVNTRPLFVALFAVIFYRERFTFYQWMAFILAFCGVLIVLYNPGTAYMPNHMFGDFLIVLNALSGAIGIMFGKKLLKIYKPFTLLVYQITIGMIGLLPLALYESHGVFEFSQVAWGPIIFLAVFSTCIAQTFFNWGLSKLPVSNTGVYFFIIPVINIILAHFMFGEPTTWLLLLGGALILVGAYFVNFKVQSKDSPVEISKYS
jgi:drug/metabolite transporter (DMT)-like permease